MRGEAAAIPTVNLVLDPIIKQRMRDGREVRGDGEPLDGGLEGCVQDASSTCLEAFCESGPFTVATSHV